MQRHFVAVLLAGIAAACPPVHAQPKTVCTITVNSADEKETIRQRLPKGQYNFVELVEKGRPDWLRSSCRRHVSCDVLVISGHFNAGDTFYSDQIDRNEYLSVDELERASCSASCPTLFSHLKEVYLFGCESLNPDATKYSSSYGESGRDRMRRIFPNVPSIYGFYSSAPVGPTAAMLLNKYFDAGGGHDFGTGNASARMMRIFGHNHITRVSGVRASDAPAWSYRNQVCQFFDERLSPAQKLAYVHSLFGNEANIPTFFERVEKLMASLDEAQRRSPGLAQALAEISADGKVRALYVDAMRRADPPTLRARMITLGATLGWFSHGEARAERVALINDVLARRSMGFAEVDLVCSLNAGHDLDGERARVTAPRAALGYAPHVAALACLGDEQAQERMLRTLASADAGDVQIAQTYLRNRPVTESGELRRIAREIARASGPGQVRAIDAIAQLNISDHEVLKELSQLFAQSRSLEVQRALAELFIRSDPAALPRPDLLGILRQHRVRPKGGGHDLIDTLIDRLQQAQAG
ncbi:MAG TPA: hypothetical protein VFP36_03255 [Usitatibacter sp.]|nr:hypothetical protein [Usitatibacter sp.]